MLDNLGYLKFCTRCSHINIASAFFCQWNFIMGHCLVVSNLQMNPYETCAWCHIKLPGFLSVLFILYSGELPTASFTVINGDGDNCSFITRSGAVCVHNGSLHRASVLFTHWRSILTLMISQMRVSFTDRWVQTARNELFYTMQLPSLLKRKEKIVFFFLFCHDYVTAFSTSAVVKKCSWMRETSAQSIAVQKE